MDRKRNIKKITLLGLILMLIGEVYIYANIGNVSHKYVALDNSIAQPVVEDIKEEKEKIVFTNKEMVGKVIIEGTDIDEYIMHHSDNDYYLHHDNNGKYAINGSIFLDYRLNLDDRKVLIYGHSSNYGNIPFDELENYYYKGFYDNHKYIDIVSEDKSYRYEIFSVYVETSDFTYMNLKISDDTYNQHLVKYKNKSLYDTGVTVSDNDEIIILQTCSNDRKYKNYRKKYLLVIGKKIFEEG